MYKRRYAFVIKRLGLFALAIALAGCANLPFEEVEPPPARTAEPVPPDSPTPPVEPARQPRPEPPRVAILLSDDIPAYTAIADELARRIGADQRTIHNLDGRRENTEPLIAEVKAAKAQRLVAIGLLAARAGHRFTDLPMVFCQVFNYRDHALIDARSRGVNLLPPLALQLKAWKQLSPDLQRVGIITGPNQEDLIAEARLAAEQLQVQLLNRVVSSDQEALYVFKRMVPDIQGFWLLPDNRILSPRSIREIMSYSSKHRKQVIVFSSRLLDLGALMSFSGQEADVADQVMALLARMGAETRTAGPLMMPLTKMQVEINPAVAQQLGLIVPRQFTSFLPGE
jgi:ABC-type uncharacterized transport system substrate-binding protein